MGFLAAIFDYMRGQQKFRGAFKALYGLVVSLVAGITGWWLALSSVLFAVGISIGWGGPVGDGLHGRSVPKPGNYEGWQLGYLRQNTWAALAFRGFLVCACMLPLAFIFPIAIIKIGISYIVAFPVAVYLAYHVAKRRGEDVGNWKIQEILRGFIAVTLIGLMP